VKPGPDYERDIWRAAGELGQWICAGALLMVVLGLAAHYFDGGW
jgi:hypothetical protein